MPSELLQSIEVSKALTPDMDADAIGGSVNLVMKQAPEKLRLFGAVGGGYNELLDTYKQNNYSLTTGRRFNGGKTGLIVSLPRCRRTATRTIRPALPSANRWPPVPL